MRSVVTITKGVPALLAVFLLMSCGSYNRKIQRYYTQMEAGKYKAAGNTLDNIRFLQRPRNQFLYYAEKGRMTHLTGLYDSSNYFLNEADRIAEAPFKSAGDVVSGTLLNPMMQTYHGEPFERLMLHFYKSLNYTVLGDPESALVEARRINIAINEQMDHEKAKDNRYSRDAFALNLQGMIYEMTGDHNNAFIAYRNAAETYLTDEGETWYGVRMPLQLKHDVLRTAYLNGFTGELHRFEKLFGITYQHSPPPEGGELILFIEDGRAPVKEEENIFFTLLKGAGGSFYFTDPTGGFSIPFDLARYNAQQVGLGSLRTFRVALPRYIVVSPQPVSMRIDAHGTAYHPELAEDINTIAVETMRENRLRDITQALTRLVVKKVAEAGARAAGKAIAQNKDSGQTEEEKKKQEEKAEAVGEAVGLLFQAFSLASEKADTRNWQSLPARIRYVRIRLQWGQNTITVSGTGGQSQHRSFEVEGRGGLQLMNLP